MVDPKEDLKKETSLILDDRIVLPPALNRHVASVSLRAIANNFDDGYEHAPTSA